MAFHAAQLGADSMLVSRVGADARGREARRLLAQAGVDVQSVGVDSGHATGSVQVTLENGEPRFAIQDRVAWDHIEFDAYASSQLARADLFCLSTLAQRTPLMAKRLQGALRRLQGNGHGRILGGERPSRTVVLLDLNLRAPFFSQDSLFELLSYVDIVKLNEFELQTMEKWVKAPGTGVEWLLEHFDLSLVALTLGERGARLYGHQVSVAADGVPVRGGDPVGAGDAFVAALSVSLARQLTLTEALRRANAYGAWVASQKGAMPTRP